MVKKLLKLKIRFFIIYALLLCEMVIYANLVPAANTSFSLLNTKAVVNAVNNTSNTYTEKLSFSNNLSFVNYLWADTPIAQAGFRKVFQKVEVLLLKEEVVEGRLALIGCPADIAVNNDPGLCTAVVTFTPPTSDVLGNTVTQISSPTSGLTSGSAFPVGTTTVTFEERNGATLVDSCNFTVTVTDNENPTVTASTDIVTTTSFDSTGNCTVSRAIPNATNGDNCSVAKLTWDMTGVTTDSSPTTGINQVGLHSFNVGTTTITYTVTDGSGRTSTDSMTVTVTDDEDPVITCPVPAASYNTDAGQCDATLSFTATATDNCTGSPAISYNIGGTAITFPYDFPIGSTIVNAVANDGNGQTDNCNFTVLVVDNENPTVTAAADVVTTTSADGTGNCTVSRAISNATYTDNCSVTKLTWAMTGVTTASSPATGINQVGTKLFNMGVSTITYIVTDGSGRTSTDSMTVTVTDDEAPVITCPVPAVSYNTDAGQCNATLSFTATATDNCNGSPAISYNIGGTPIIFPYDFPKGSTIVNAVANDGNGQTANCNFTVVVADNEVPVISCPANITVTNTPSTCGVVVNYTDPVGTDNCSGATTAQTVGLASGAIFPVGTTTNTFEVTDAAGNKANCSFTVTVIDAAAGASVSISASTTDICQNESVTFTATPDAGETSPLYQFKVNGANVGPNSTTNTYTTTGLTNGQVVTVEMTSSLSGCGTKKTSTNSIVMTVNPTLNVSFNINGINTICAGQSVTFSSGAIINGGTTPTYQWFVGATPTVTTANFTSSSLVNGDVITLQITSSARCATPLPKTSSNSITMTVNPNATISDPGNKNQTVCINNAIAPIAFTIGGGGTGATVSVLPTGLTGGYSGGTFTISGTPSVSGTFPYTVTTTGTCSQTSQNGTISVTPDATISLTSANNNQTVCANASISPISYTIGGSGTGATVSGLPLGINGVYNSGTFTISGSSTGTFAFTVTATGSCASESATGSITINPNLTPAVTISSSDGDNTICAGTSVTFTATPTNGGATPSYQWKLNGSNVGTNSPTYTTTALTNGQSVTVVMTSNETCLTSPTATSVPIETTVNPNLMPTVSISATATTICAGTSVTFTATPTNGGPTPSYQWKVGGTNVGTNSPTYTTTGLTNGQIVTVVMTSNETCLASNNVVSNLIATTVNPNLTPTVSIISSDADNIICSGTSVTFTATITNGGAAPTYQWKLNGANVGTNSPTYTTTALTNGQTVSVVLTSNATCLASNNIPSNIITTQVDSPISGITPIFDYTNPAHNPTAICPVIAGLVYTINPIPGATSYSWTFPAGWVITSGGTTNSVTVTASSTAASGNVTVRGINNCGPTNSSILPVSTGSFTFADAGLDQSICFGTTAVTLLGNAGGAIKNFKDYWWDDNGAGGTVPDGPNKLTGTYTLPTGATAGTVITLTLQTVDPPGSCNAAVDTMTITVLPLPIASISGNIAICSGSNANVIFTATPNTTVTYNINGGAPQTINVGGSGTATLNTGALSSTTNYNLVSVAYSSGTSCTRTISGTAIITVTQLPTVNAGGPNTVCQSATPSAITLSGATIGGGATTGAWSIISGGGTLSSIVQTATPQSITYTPPANYSGAVTLRLTTNAPGACAAIFADRTITVTQLPTVEAGNQNTVCQSSSPSAITLSGASIGGGATTGAWSITSGGGTLSSTAQTATPQNITYIPAINFTGTVILTLTTNAPNSCAAVSDTRIILVEPEPTVEAGNQNTVCQSSSPSAITLSGASIGGGATTGAWSITSGGGTLSSAAQTASPNTVTYTPAANYTGTIALTLTTNAPGTCTAVSDTRTIIIDPAPTAEAGGADTLCQSSTPIAMTLSGASIGGGATTGAWSITSGGGTLSSIAQTATPQNITYTPAANFTGTVTLTLTTNASGTCVAVSDTRTININEAATIDAGSNQTICSNNTATMSANFGGGASSGIWTTSGSGSFNNNLPTAIYTPSANDINNGAVTLTYTTNDPLGPCGTVSDTMSLTVKEAVQITTQPQNVGVCVTNAASLSVVGFGDDLTYQWYKGSFPGTAVTNSANISGVTSATLNFSQAALSDGGTYYVVVSGDTSCATVRSTEVTLNVNQVMNFTSQPITQTLCEGSNATFSITATGAISSYQWRKNGVNIFGANAAVYTINNITTANNGNYDIVLTGIGGTCPNAFSNVATLTVTQIPTATISYAGTPFCNSISTAQPVTRTGTNAYTGGTYSAPAGLSINASTGAITPSTSTAGTYTVTYTIPASGGCGTVTATTSVTITALPTATISYAGTPFCNSVTTAQTVALTGANAYTGGTFSALVGLTINTTTGAITPSTSTAGTYTVTYTIPASGGCSTQTATTSITITALPVATFNYGTTTFCKSSANPAVSFTGGGVAGVFTATPAGLSINASTGAINLAASTVGTYTVTNTIATAGGCNAVSHSETITIDPVSVGGSLTGYATDQAGNPYSNPIVYSTNLLACESTDGLLVLNGYTGNIIRWEYSTNGGVTWVTISNPMNTYSYSNILETRIFRAVIQSGNCVIAYSNIVSVSVVPQDIKPDPVSASVTTLCLGGSTVFTATSGFGTGQIMEGGGFNTGQFPDKTNDDKWRLDGVAVGTAWTASADNTEANNWAGTNDHPFGTYPIFYGAPDGKFAIANGNLLTDYYGGLRDNTTLETPRFNTFGLTTATFNVLMAWNLELNDYAKIELSLDGGVTYNIVLFSKTGKTDSGIFNPLQPFSFSLNDYVGQADLRIKFTFKGTTVNSVWALDEIKIPTPPVDENIVWTDENQKIISTTTTYSETPSSPGVHDYYVTSFINGCVYTITPANTVKITISVNSAYAGKDVAILPADCGNNTVKLNAYDNKESAAFNIAKGAWDSVPPNNYVTDDDPGTGAIGKWTITSTTGTCGTGTFSTNYPTKYPDPTNDPDATFTGEAGIYVLTWTSGGCSDDVQITLTDCTSINFDGVNDNITFKNNYNLTSPFSIEVWVKPNSVSGTRTIFSKRDDGNVANGYDLKLTNNIISFNWNNLGITSPFNLTTNRWYHIAVTFDGTYRLYIDGIEVINSGGGKSAPGTNTFECILGAMDKSGSAPVNYFNGWMDELRIWNVALNPDQLRQMMNQEIQNNLTLVRGAVVPIDVNPLTWASILGYYQMSSISCGYLNPTAGTVTGKLRNITNVQEQTAPIPYTSKGNGNWNDTSALTPWTYGNSVWDYPNSKGYNNIPIDWNIVRTGHNVISNTQDVTLLGLLVDANQLTITGVGTQDENNAGHGLWITHYLKLNGNIDLVGESQLVQKRHGVYDSNSPYNFLTTQFSESIFDEASTGYIERDQQGQKNSFNYNYWSSPVTRQGAANNAPYTLANVLRDGTYSATPRNIDFVDGAYSADSPNGSNPIKITSRWIWTYNAVTNGNVWDNYYQWKNVGYWGQIKVGDGYSMKGTGGAALITATQNYVFVGKPNSGDITTTQLNLNQTYLIGNPYPSTLDANEFIKNNLKDCSGCTGSANVFNGALYFWDHFELSNNHLLAEYEGGYATLNLMGGVVAIANVPLTASTNNSGSKIPERYIPVGQGFFVEATLPILSGTGTLLASGNLYFKNSQRVFQREVVTGTNSGSVFMKTAVSKKSETIETTADSRPKIRLTFDSPLGYRRPLLVGVDENASNLFDFGYDAPLNEDNKEDMFWQLGNGKLVIQGVNNFNEDQELPLGLKIAKTGLATIKIEEVKNIDENITIHIKDKLTGKTHNISQKQFEIELEPSTYLDRFVLIFKYQKLMAEDLGTDILIVEPQIEDKNYHVFMNNAGEELQIKNNGTDEIRSVMLHNNLGQIMNTWNADLNRRIISLPVKLASGVYIVQINTTKGTISKRIIIK